MVELWNVSIVVNRFIRSSIIIMVVSGLFRYCCESEKMRLLVGRCFSVVVCVWVMLVVFIMV